MASKRKVCVLGLGSMGLGVALALLERQFDVSGFDINKQACKSFAEAGGKVGLNPEDAAKGASVVIILVVNEAQVDEVLFGNEGAMGGFGVTTVATPEPPISLPPHSCIHISICRRPMKHTSLSLPTSSRYCFWHFFCWEYMARSEATTGV